MFAHTLPQKMQAKRQAPSIYLCMALMVFSHQRAGFAEQKFFLLREIRAPESCSQCFNALPALCCLPSSLIHLFSVSAFLLKSPWHLWCTINSLVQLSCLGYIYELCSFRGRITLKIFVGHILSFGKCLKSESSVKQNCNRERVTGNVFSELRSGKKQKLLQEGVSITVNKNKFWSFLS